MGVPTSKAPHFRLQEKNESESNKGKGQRIRKKKGRCDKGQRGFQGKQERSNFGKYRAKSSLIPTGIEGQIRRETHFSRGAAGGGGETGPCCYFQTYLYLLAIHQKDVTVCWRPGKVKERRVLYEPSTAYRPGQGSQKKKWGGYAWSYCWGGRILLQGFNTFIGR